MVWRYPGQRAGLSANELNRTNAAVERVERSRLGLAELTAPEDQQSHWVWIRNDSGADRERFDCMSLGDPIFEMLDDGTVDLLFEGLTAAADKTPAILLEPIADGEMGKAVIHGLALARVGSGSTSERTATPDSEVKLLPVLLGSGSVLAHYLFTLTGTISSGSGAATIRNLADDSDIATATVKDPLGHFDGLTSGYRGYCFAAGGNYYAIGPYVIDVRYVLDTALEQSRKPGTYTNIETPEEC